MISAVQQAVYQKLTGDATLMGLVTGIYDEVPPGTEPPYVVIEGIDSTADDSLDAPGLALRISLHVWSQAAGWLESERIAQRIYELLHRQPLAVTGWAHVGTWLVDQQMLRDGELRHLVSDYRIEIRQP